LNSVLTSCLSITFRMFSSSRYIFTRSRWSASISSHSSKRPEFQETVAVLVEHLLNEFGGTHYDELLRHDRWRVMIKRLVVLVTLGLDARQARDEHDGVRCDLLDECVLVSSIQRIKEFASSWPLVANVILDAHDVDPHWLDRHVLNLTVVVIALV
jgi:hypothetical protein